MAFIPNRSSEENKETFTLIWFDPNKGEYEIEIDTMKTLRAINDYILVYTNYKECISYIESVKNENIFLVISGTWAPFVLSSIINLKQLEVVYIFDTDREQHLYLMEKYSKISGIFIDYRELASSIHKNLFLLHKQVETFSFYDQNQKVSMNLSERTAEFLW
jgi:hypothetical protein